MGEFLPNQESLPEGPKTGQSCVAARKSLHIGHTSSRREELFVDEILESNEINQKTKERLRGKMVFFECYATFGRSANRALNVVTHAYGNVYCVALSEEVISALNLLKDRLLTARPLLVEPALFDTWIIFTDGSCEAASRASGIGGVLLDPNGKCVAFCSERVPKEFLDSLLEVLKIRFTSLSCCQCC